MSDRERLTEALEMWARFGPKRGDNPGTPLSDINVISAAARAYRDLLAEGAELDYEAALASWEASRDTLLSDAEAIHLAVDAAIGDRLLIDPTTEEEE